MRHVVYGLGIGVQKGHKEVTSPTVAVIAQKVRAKNFVENMDEKELNEMALLRQMNRLKEEEGHLKCENEQL